MRMLPAGVATFLMVAAAALFAVTNPTGEEMKHTIDTPPYERATLGGGCFWCLEPIFENVKGVSDVEAGYAGGQLENPTYQAVCTGTTGHAEVIQVTFDPEIVSYRQLLDIFFSVHDPTTVDRQGADVGSQYRSIILAHSDEQEHAARNAIEAWNHEGTWKDPIVTEVTAHTEFFKAEDDHQEYYENNPDQAYCRLVIAPKMKKFKKLFKDMLK